MDVGPQPWSKAGSRVACAGPLAGGSTGGIVCASRWHGTGSRQGVRSTSMDETRHVALPKLYGAPAYARPPAAVAHTQRPADPDDLPIVAEMTDDERTLADHLVVARQSGRVPGAAPSGTAAAGTARSAGTATATAAGPGSILPRPFSIRGFADRIRRPRP